MDIVPVTATDFPRAARMLSRAFASDPCWRYMFPDATRRHSQIAWFFERWLSALEDLGEIRADADKTGLTLWLPPGALDQVCLRRLVRHGMLGAPFVIGPTALARFMRIGAEAERAYRSEVNQPHWVLDVLAVDPGHQGKGIAAALLRFTLDRLDRERLPAHVTTHNPDNAPFYARFGFVETSRRALEGGQWAVSMRRMPRDLAHER